MFRIKTCRVFVEFLFNFAYVARDTLTLIVINEIKSLQEVSHSFFVVNIIVRLSLYKPISVRFDLLDGQRLRIFV
jgi:hypothetical protein